MREEMEDCNREVRAETPTCTMPPCSSGQKAGVRRKTVVRGLKEQLLLSVLTEMREATERVGEAAACSTEGRLVH